MSPCAPNVSLSKFVFPLPLLLLIKKRICMSAHLRLFSPLTLFFILSKGLTFSMHLINFKGAANRELVIRKLLFFFFFVTHTLYMYTHTDSIHVFFGHDWPENASICWVKRAGGSAEGQIYLNSVFSSCNWKYSADTFCSTFKYTVCSICHSLQSV